MLILVVEPGSMPETREITGSLEEMQELVGGLIQVIYPFPEEVALVCNDEGKLLGLPLNRCLRLESGEIYDVVAGTFFLCAAPADSEHFESLTADQLERYRRRFAVPELYI